MEILDYGSSQEFGSEKGLRYGSIPDAEVLKKYEETEPNLISEVRGTDAFDTRDDEFGNYVRSEIIDWSPDNNFTEADHSRRDPSWSRSSLNLRYNGTRGTHPELPRHPELFYGFMGNDPRGVNIQDPNFSQVRGFVTSAAANLAVRFGQNDDNSIPERPWTSQSLSYDKKRMQERLRRETKVFSVEKVGRPYGRNEVVNELIHGRHRRMMNENGRDGLQGDQERFFAGDYQLAADSNNQGVRGVDRASGANTIPWQNTRIDGDFAAMKTTDQRRGQARPHDEAPWRNSIGDTDLPVQKYGQNRGGGRTDVASGATGGARASNSREDQDLPTGELAKSTARQTLAANMALATKYSKVARKGAADTDHGQSRQNAALGKMPILRDVTQAYRNQNATITNVHLANTEAIVKGLREGTASAKRKISNQIIAAGVRNMDLAEKQWSAGRTPQPSADMSTMDNVVADGARNTDLAEKFGQPGRTPVASSDPARVSKYTDMPMHLPEAAKGLEVHSYRGVAPQRADPANRGKTTSDFGQQSERAALGKSARQEFLSHTQDQTELSDDANNTFGYTGENAYRAVSGLKTKTVRATQADEDITARDEMDGMGEVL